MPQTKQAITKQAIIAPSILSADFARLGDEVMDIDNKGADWIHMDVMDGHYVPNLTFGPPVIKCLRPHTKKPFDVHLMIEPVDCHIASYVDAGADIITVHAEATTHLDRTLALIRSFGKKAGVSLNPSTPETLLQYVLDKVDVILVMSVNPGFGGQSFIASQVEKIARIKRMIRGSDIVIEVDGGIKDDNVHLVAEAGANVIVAGSFIFSAKDRQRAIATLRESVNKSLPS